MKKIFIICLILFMFFSIASVSASDANDTVIASESQNNLDDSLQIDNKITEESEIANVNDTNNYFDNNEEDFYQNEPLSISFENSDVLGDDPDFQYVVDGDAYGSGVPMYVAMTDYGFILKDGNIGQQRYFTQHSDGNYYPSCYAESFDFDPHTFKIGDDTYLLTYGSGDVWYYKKISYSQPKYSSIIVEDYDFVNHQYPFIGSGDQYSSVSIPVQVLDSNGNGANGGIIVTDSLGTQVGTAQVSNGYARVSMTLTKSGKSEYNIQFNSANSNVASTSTSFYITARAQQVSIFLRAVNDDEELVLRAGSTVRLDVATLGASSGAMCFVWRDAKGKQLYAADADNPVFQIDSSEHPNCLFNVPEWEGDYMITLCYGSGSAWHDFDVKASRTYKVHVILAMSLSGPDNITAKIGSSVNFNVYVKEKVVKDPDLQTDDPFAMFNNYKWISVDGGYVSAKIHGNEYQFPVVNGVAEVNLYVDGYLGNPSFTYKRGVGFDSPISINFNYIPCDIELIYDNPIITNSDSTFCSDIEVLADGYHINGGTLILDIIDKQTGNISKSYTSKVSYGKATFNITFPEAINDYNYTLRYNTAFPTTNNVIHNLTVYTGCDDTLKSELLDLNNNNISSVEGKYSGKSIFKIKVTDEVHDVNNNFVKLIIRSTEYISEINNNEANFNFINEYFNEDTILMFYVADGKDFFVRELPYHVLEKDAIISFNYTNISREFTEGFYPMIVNVYDEFGNPLNGRISSSEYHNSFYVYGGRGYLQIINSEYPIGSYNDSLIFNAEGVNETRLNYSFQVTPVEAFIQLEKTEIDFGFKGNIKINILDKYGNEIYYYYDYLKIENEGFVISPTYLQIMTITPGEYNLTINGISKNKNYKNFTATIPFKININKEVPKLSIHSNCEIGQDKFLYIDIEGSKYVVRGDVTVVVNDIEYQVYYNGNTYNLSLELPNQIGEYKGYLKYFGSGIYESLEKNFTICIEKGETSINITSPSTITPGEIIISGYLNCDELLFKDSDNIKLFIGNEQYPVEIIRKTNNQIYFQSNGINIGYQDISKQVRIVFEETDYLKSSVCQFSLKMTAYSQKLNIPNIVVEFGKDIPIAGYFENVLEDYINEDAVIIFDDLNSDYMSNLATHGRYSFEGFIYPLPSVGTYNFHARLYNDRVFGPCDTYFNITVTEPKKEIDATMAVVVKDDNYLNGADINIKLSQNIDVKANVILNNQKVSTINIVAGVGNTHVNNLIVGENTVKIELDDKDYHGLCTETFDAHEILSNDKIDIKLPETNSNDNSIVVNLPKDAQGEVILKINNQEYKFKVENGVSNVKLPDLKNGNYDYTITYSGDGKYSSFTKSNNLVVNKVLKTTIVANDISVVYKSNKYVDISLKDSEGKPVANVDIRININGETTTLSLDSFGTTSYSTELLKPKTYTATITFGGNKKYDKSTATVKVTVKKATPKITAKAKTFKKSVKTKKYTITLKTNQNKVMKNTKVTIKVNKKTYTAKTNSKGVATFKITKLNKKGTFKAIVAYKGNSYYNKVTKKVNIKVK